MHPAIKHLGRFVPPVGAYNHSDLRSLFTNWLYGHGIKDVDFPSVRNPKHQRDYEAWPKSYHGGTAWHHDCSDPEDAADEARLRRVSKRYIYTWSNSTPTQVRVRQENGTYKRVQLKPFEVYCIDNHDMNVEHRMPWTARQPRWTIIARGR